MKCPNCEFNIDDDMLYCGKCGTKMERQCPQCGFLNPLHFLFCGKCGQKLDIPSEPEKRIFSVDEKIQKIQKYLPKGLTDKILSQKDRIEGERKQVTVMFCDMKGFTSLSESLGAEDAYTIMDQVYEILIHKVHDYEGTVNEFTGDGIMALFGAPIALEDAPQRAIRSAYAIHREMTRFSDKLQQEKEEIFPIRMRIGINSGPVVVGTLGNDLRVEFKAVGDTVNLASRMEGISEPGTTYVTENTFKLTEGFFRFEALGKKEIKGKIKSIKVYRVIAPSTRKTRFDVSAEQGLTPFIGRGREFELLLDGFKRVKQGRGQVFSIMAEAGLGKSRLLYEFRKAIVSEDATFLEGKCLSYSRGEAYHPVIDVLKSNFEIQDGERDFEIVEKVRSGIKAIGVGETQTLPYLLDLLSVEESGINGLSMSPEEKKERIIGAVDRITLKGSEIRPLILAIEDLHWIDKYSKIYFKNLMDRIPGSKIFLIFTYRPEFVHTWGRKSYHSQITLTRLSDRESNAVMTHILEEKNIDTSLKKLILEKTEGVPFFIEEFIKSLKEMNLIKVKNHEYYLSKDIEAVSIPSTIQDIIMARVDSQAEGAKELLQIGSVIEREFSYELIKIVTEKSENTLNDLLFELRDSELIYERGIYPKSVYVFKHALTRAVVYDSILIKRKKRMHGNIGSAIETLYKDNIHEYYGVLVTHFIESGDYIKAAEYSKLAGNKAESSVNFQDAIAYAKKRIFCLEKCEKTEQIEKKIIDARTNLGYYFIKMDYFSEAKKPIGPIVDLARKYDYKSKLPDIISILGIYKWSVEENYNESITYFKEALKISNQINDISLSRFPNYWMGVALSFMCQFKDALQHFEIAMEIVVKKGTLWDIAVVKSCIGYFVHAHQGNADFAYQSCDKALQLAEETMDVFPKAFAYSNFGVACYIKGSFDKAEEHLLKGISFCEKIGIYTWNAFTQHNLGELYFDMGEYDKSKEHYANSILVMKKNQTMPSWNKLNRVCLAKAKVMGNEKNIDIEPLFEDESTNKIELYSGLIKRSIGEIFLNIDDRHIPEAEDWIKKAIETNIKNDMMWQLGKDHALYAELFKRKGDQPNARDMLKKAVNIFKKCKAQGWVDKYKKKISVFP
ncbi:adenylate/guanylate cyclase domain-containing protein [Desulfobacula sp.]|uniref:adenylate/guanylate cyclase domain-containing protein n=1 Tax=Desulfobacula sp. TaxID=2593537 RepID=UPI0026189A8C|nr:adenylate/guanylate cyclase domain-containing protein [Desulfobacula sp.]